MTVNGDVLGAPVKARGVDPVGAVNSVLSGAVKAGAVATVAGLIEAGAFVDLFLDADTGRCTGVSVEFGHGSKSFTFEGGGVCFERWDACAEAVFPGWWWCLFERAVIDAVTSGRVDGELVAVHLGGV